jgi:uncharacterized GH25 family protein
MFLKKSLVLAALALSATGAYAHQIWIEPAGKAYAMHFGEYDENLKETTPGLLDKMPAPAVLSLVGNDEKAVAVRKEGDGFALDAKTLKDGSLVAEVRNYPTFERKTGEQVTRGKWVPAARHAVGHAAQAPKNILDMVPAGSPGKFKLYFRGQPLPKVKLTLVAPNGWQKPLQSDDQGEFEVATLWQGLYVIEVSHKENVAGEIDGDKYDSASFTSTLSFFKADGPKTPRPEAAKPNQMK